MFIRRISSRSALVATVVLSMLAFASAALAAGPATVTVEVEGLTETKLPPTQVTTTTVPVVKDNKEGNPEGSCAGTSAAGALQLATGGNWSGPWSSKYNQYEIFTIEGETHLFEEGSKANYYWSFWLNDKESTEGACETELEAGDRVLFFPACYGEDCPPSPTPLGLEAPPSADANEPVTVTVSQYTAKGEASPAVGATVSGGGTSAMTDSQGHATLKFYGDGTYTLEAIGSDEAPTPGVRTETTICVHEGNDGTCGTTAPHSGPVVNPPSGGPLVTSPLLPVTATIAGRQERPQLRPPQGAAAVEGDRRGARRPAVTCRRDLPQASLPRTLPAVQRPQGSVRRHQMREAGGLLLGGNEPVVQLPAPGAPAPGQLHL